MEGEVDKEPNSRGAAARQGLIFAYAWVFATAWVLQLAAGVMGKGYALHRAICGLACLTVKALLTGRQ